MNPSTTKPILSKTVLIILFLLMCSTWAMAIGSEQVESISFFQNADWIAFLIGVLGLLLLFVPYLSFFGLLLCLTAIVLAIRARKKGKRKWLRRLAWLCGSIGITVFLTVLGLIWFF